MHIVGVPRGLVKVIGILWWKSLNQIARFFTVGWNKLYIVQISGFLDVVWVNL